MGFTRPAVERGELLGYTDRPGAAPGERLAFMVSSEFETYEVQLVRLQHADENEAGPGFIEFEIDHEVNGERAGRRQSTPVGSYVVANSVMELPGDLTVAMWIKASVPTLGRDQAVWSCLDETGHGVVVALDGAGRPMIRVIGSHGHHTAVVDEPLRANQWYHLNATVDSAAGVIAVAAELGPDWPVPDRRLAAEESGVTWEPVTGEVLIAAGGRAPSPIDGRLAPVDVFNGRLEGPAIWSRVLSDEESRSVREGAAPSEFDGLVGWWDFADDDPATYATNRIADRSGAGRHATAVNYPTRAVLGHHWDRSIFDFRSDPAVYSAIEFHDDDNEDCGWEPAVHFEVPADLASGVYALRLRARWGLDDATEDHIPFFVRPRRGHRSADVAYLISSITYQAYGNESVLATSPDTDWTSMTDIDIVADPYDAYVWDHPELGFSIYDAHSDGTGINYSSWRRPMLNMRPKHRFWVTGAPRHFAADLYPIDWMVHEGIEHDVITDHDLHEDGLTLLDGYRVLITCSHPEYWTEPMQVALEQYLARGGRLIYLGGNGFYWVTAVDPHRPHIIEVRRGYSSSRTWNGHPAESHLASTGEAGGIWRFRGRSPNAITGVGFSAQGWSVKAPPFERLPDSDDPRAAFIFEGVPDRIIGDFGLVMDGAAGDEIDRCDEALGSPPLRAVTPSTTWWSTRTSW